MSSNESLQNELNEHDVTGVPAKRVKSYVWNSSTLTWERMTQPIANLQGFDIPQYDKIDLTYVLAGNGAGEIETVVYSLDGVTVATLTLSYDSSNKVTSVGLS